MTLSRRSFLKTSGASIASLSLSSATGSSVFGQEDETSLVVGLIGCKGRGWSNLSNFLKVSGVRCAALCDVDERWLNRRANDVKNRTGEKPDLYGDFRRLIDRDDIDAVIIGTPDHWHCLPTVRACQAGKDVYVEKPLANSIAECNVMLDAARKHDTVVQVGQQQRSAAHWKKAIEFVRSGKLGTIREVKAWANFNYAAGRPKVDNREPPDKVDFDMWLGPAPDRPFNPNRFHGLWRLFWDYGGGLTTDWGVHLLDMLIWGMELDGPPNAVMAHGGIFASKGNALETPDTQTVIYEFDDFTMSWEHNAGIQSGPWGRNYGVAFIGTNGTLLADRSNWEVKPEGSGDGKRMDPVSPKNSEGQSLIKHVRNFIECVENRNRPAADIAIGRQAALYAHLGNIAYRTGNRVVWDEEEQKFVDDEEANQLVKPEYHDPWSFPNV